MVGWRVTSTTKVVVEAQRIYFPFGGGDTSRNGDRPEDGDLLKDCDLQGRVTVSWLLIVPVSGIVLHSGDCNCPRD